MFPPVRHGMNGVANHSGDSPTTHRSRVLRLLSGLVVDLSPMMPAMQFHVTNERGLYLCTARALVFEGSILAYNPTLNEAKWIPLRGLAKDLSWPEERSVVALANYVLHTLKEAEKYSKAQSGRSGDLPG